MSSNRMLVESTWQASAYVSSYCELGGATSYPNPNPNPNLGHCLGLALILTVTLTVTLTLTLTLTYP